MMPFFTLTRRVVSSAAPLVVLLASGTAHAGLADSSLALPVLLGKNWAIGYVIVALCILLGLLAVTVTSMRKVLRRKDGY